MEWKQGKRKYFELDPTSGSVDISMLQYMHPAIAMIITWSNLWCYNHNIKPQWTSWMRTPAQNKALKASKVHGYRAADISIKKEHGWTKELLAEYQFEIKDKFTEYGSFVYDKNHKLIRRPLLLHDNGNGIHIHLQVAR